MKNQNTKRLKRITALVLCVVLLLTSIPIAFAANGEYNPAPYFSYDAQQKGAAAWLDEEGDLQIRFPAATGRPTHADWKKNNANVKAIDSYYIELSNLGGVSQKHNTNPPVLLYKTVSAASVGTGKLSAVFTAEELAALGEDFDIEKNRYNVAITAIDSEGWRSLQLHAMVYDIPEFAYDSSKFQTFTEDTHAMREMMLFENTGDYSGHQASGDSADRIAKAIHDGAPDPNTGVNSTAYRVRVIKQPSAGTQQSVDIVESRQTWDFVDAEEVWYWLDLSNVELKGLSFRLRSNSKGWKYDLNRKQKNDEEHDYGSVIYSTIGTQYNTYAAGDEPFVWIQNENGNWEKLLMNDGTIDLGHFKGYVRIPIEYFCAEEDVKVSTRTTLFGQQMELSSTGSERDAVFVSNSAFADDAYWDSGLGKMVYPTKVTVDTAGTPVTQALLIQSGYIKGYKKNWIGQWNEYFSYNMDSYLAVGLSDAQMLAAAGTEDARKRAGVEKNASGEWVVTNRENGYKALEDIYSAGLAYNSVSEDSLEESFFIDNIMFYRTDGGEWAEASLNGAVTTGSSVGTYFNQGQDAQDRILDAIDKYIGTPSWTDYRGVRFVQSMIATLNQTYVNAKGEAYANQYFTDEKMAEYANKVGRTQSWNDYKEALALCEAEGLLDGNNSGPNDLVPQIVQMLEQLPDPSTVTSMSDTLYREVVKLYKAYIRLNYGQLKMLGSYVSTDADGNILSSYEEEKLLKYAALLANQMDEDTETGYKMANYPFISFNNFEENTAVGDRAWRLEDDPNFAGASDYRQTKNFSTLTTNDRKVVDGNNHTISQSYSEAHDYPHTGDTRITKEGFGGTNGLSTTFDSTAVQGNAEDGVYYAIYFNKDSRTDATDQASYRANNMSAVNLGQLAKNNDPDYKSALRDQVKNSDGTSYLPFSLVMYVDFSELTDETNAGDFTFGVKIHTTDGSGKEICYRPAMGSSIGGNKYWRSYFLLDQNPDSANFGEWKRVFVKDRSWTKGNYLFPSKTTNPQDGEEPASLAGYKGYIAIPMNHFKRTNGAVPDNEMLVEKSTELNNIYSITFGITNANGEAMNNKTFTIDNVGFTYDPDYYRDHLGVDTSGRDDPTYAEAFSAKSSKASDFEAAVADIDPYDSTTLAAKIEVAKHIYGEPYYTEKGALSQWQKDNIETVKQAKALLDKYIAGDIPEAAMSVDALKTEIAKLPSGIPENAVTSKPLPNPGFIVNASDPLAAGAVNYTDFGFVSRTQAEDIAKLYTDTYKRLSATDKASLTDKERTALINAYNAAMRCTGTLETIKTKGTYFSNRLKTVYTRYTDGTQTLNLISVSKRNEVAALSADEYDPLPYYAKLGLSNGSLIPAFKNMTDGISRFFANTVMNSETGEIEAGGVKVLMDKYTALYNEVKTYLDAKEKLPDEAEYPNNLVSRLNDAIEEYNDLIPAYKNIFELYYGSVKEDASGTYQGIKDIIELFDRYDTAFENPVEGTEGKTATLALNPDNESTASQTLNVNYIEELPVKTGGAVKTYFKIHYEGALTGGVDSRSYVLMLNGNEIPAVDKTADPIMITEAMLGDTLKNNTYYADNPFKMAFTAKLTDTRLFAQQLSDVVKIYQYRPADPEKGETGEQLIDTYTLNVTYTPKESYVVTIPAEFPIDWGYIDDVDVSYEVDCVLGTGKKIEVDVTGSGKLTAEANSAYTMDYTAEGFGSKSVFTGVHTGSRPANAPTVKISQNMWDNSPVGKYKDTLTYTVEYTTP